MTRAGARSPLLGGLVSFLDSSSSTPPVELGISGSEGLAVKEELFFAKKRKAKWLAFRESVSGEVCCAMSKPAPGAGAYRWKCLTIYRAAEAQGERCMRT